MTQIKLPEARERLRKTVAGREDYKYPRATRSGGSGNCVYFEDDGTPSCIVGHAFADVLRAVAVDGDSYNAEPVSALPLDFTKRALAYLNAAQTAQDGGQPWGEALEAAEAAVTSVTYTFAG